MSAKSFLEAKEKAISKL